MRTHNVFYQYKKITRNYPKYKNSAAVGFLLGAQERVRTSRGKRAISVRATEVLLHRHKHKCRHTLLIGVLILSAGYMKMSRNHANVKCLALYTLENLKRYIKNLEFKVFLIKPGR